MKNWRAEWRGQLRKLAMLSIPVAGSVLAGAIAKAAYPGKVAGQLAVWAWCAIPGLVRCYVLPRRLPTDADPMVTDPAQLLRL